MPELEHTWREIHTWDAFRGDSWMMVIIGGCNAQETVLLCLQDIAAGMACLHGLGVLHRCAEILFSM